MDGIVFLSETNGVAKNLFAQLSKEFNSKFQEINADALNNILKDKPQLIIVSVNYLYEVQQSIVSSILMNIHDVPIVIYGDRDVCHAYYQNTQSDVIGYIITPITDEDFINRLKTIWKSNIGSKKDVLRQPVAAKQNKRKVLVVDDDPVCLRQMMNMLKNDFVVAVATSGKLCLDYLSHEKPDIILLDYMMPEMDGVQTLKMIRQNPKWANIPVLFLTGVQDKNMIQEALNVKPQGYILKNSGNSSLLKKISSFFSDL